MPSEKDIARGTIPQIGAFNSAAKNCASAKELGVIFSQAVKNYLLRCGGLNLEQAVIDVSSHVKSNLDPDDLQPITSLNDILNWVSRNPNNTAMLPDKVLPTAAAEGVNAGLQNLGIYPLEALDKAVA